MRSVYEESVQVPPSWPAPQPIAFATYSSANITCTAQTPTNIAVIPVANIYFNVRTISEDEDNGNIVLQVNNPIVNDSVIGIFTFVLTTDDTAIEPGVYSYDVWFTNDPYEKPVAWGQCIVKKQQWQSFQNLGA